MGSNPIDISIMLNEAFSIMDSYWPLIAIMMGIWLSLILTSQYYKILHSVRFRGEPDIEQTLNIASSSIRDYEDEEEDEPEQIAWQTCHFCGMSSDIHLHQCPHCGANLRRK